MAQASADNALIGQLNAAKQATQAEEASGQKAEAAANSDVQALASTLASLAAATRSSRRP